MILTQQESFTMRSPLKQLPRKPDGFNLFKRSRDLRNQRPHSRALRFESMEQRELLAVGTLDDYANTTSAANVSYEDRSTMMTTPLADVRAAYDTALIPQQTVTLAAGDTRSFEFTLDRMSDVEIDILHDADTNGNTNPENSYTTWRGPTATLARLSGDNTETLDSAKLWGMITLAQETGAYSGEDGPGGGLDQAALTPGTYGVTVRASSEQSLQFVISARAQTAGLAIEARNAVNWPAKANFSYWAPALTCSTYGSSTDAIDFGPTGELGMLIGGRESTYYCACDPDGTWSEPVYACQGGSRGGIISGLLQSSNEATFFYKDPFHPAISQYQGKRKWLGHSR